MKTLNILRLKILYDMRYIVQNNIFVQKFSQNICDKISLRVMDLAHDDLILIVRKKVGIITQAVRENIYEI